MTELPQMGLGTFRLKGDTAIDAVTTALELGYQHIDTAQMYDNESDVGNALKQSGLNRQDYFLTTKVWFDKFRQGQFLPSVQHSLEKLHTDHVDLLLVHWPSPNNEVPMEEYLGQLRDAKEQGLTRHIGVSNFTINQLEQAIEILGAEQIATNQIEVQPYLQNHQLVDVCQQHGIKVTGYMPLAVGKAVNDPVVRAIAEKHQVEPAQIVFAWLNHRQIATIPSSTNRQHMAMNLEFANISLDQHDLAEIHGLDCSQREANPPFAPVWDQQ